MIKIIVIALGSLVAIGLLVFLIGYLLPQNHTASCSALIQASPETVWEAITTRREPSWRSNLKKVELLEADGSRWRETDSSGDLITYAEVEREPGSRLVTRIDDNSLPFGGTWTYQIEAAEGVTRLRITENGEVYNPIFRFVSHFFMDSTATMRQYLQDLGAHLGQEVRVENES